MLNRWMEEYKDDIDLNEINWINLDYKELGCFLKENYYDLIDKTYVTDKIINSNYFIPWYVLFILY